MLVWIVRRLSRSLWLVSLPLASLSGCSDAKTYPEQALVVGDGFEVTLPELEQVLRAAPPVPKAAVAPMRRALLDSLIAQSLLADAARDAKVDREPEMVHAFEAAKRAILADAYVSRLVGNQPAPSKADVQRYYEQHPELFGERVRLRFKEFALPADTPEIGNYLRLLDASGFEALATELAQSQPSVAPVEVSRLSSDLPAGARENLTKLRPGTEINYETPGVVHLGQVVSVEPAPVQLAEAQEMIARTIVSDRRQAIAKAAVDDMRKRRHVRIVNPDLQVKTAR